MKKIFVTTFMFAVLLLCSCCHSVQKGAITAEMAYEGVNNYCHSGDRFGHDVPVYGG